MSTPSTSTAAPSAPSTADVLFSALAQLTDAVAGLIGSMMGFTPQITELIKANKDVNLTTETLVETLEE